MFGSVFAATGAQQVDTPLAALGQRLYAATIDLFPKGYRLMCSTHCTAATQGTVSADRKSVPPFRAALMGPSLEV